ncbi:MAG: hypothetical protein ABL921_24945 [Pirellula sp.]
MSSRFFVAFLFLTSALSNYRAMASDKIVLVAGGERQAVDIPAISARLYEPFGAEFDAVGNLWIIEMASGNRLLKMDHQGVLTHVAGKMYRAVGSQPLTIQSENEPGPESRFNGPHNLAIAADGTVLIADTWNGRIREVHPKTHQVRSLASYSVPIEKAKSSGPYCISLDPQKKALYVADLNFIRALNLGSGMSSIVAGNGKKGVPPDGSIAKETPLVDPRAVAVDSRGKVYILERGGHALRVVSPDGTIKTVVNASGKKGLSEIRGSGLDAAMNGPKHMCVDQQDRVVIADAENHIVLRYDPKDGTITRIAGTGKSGRDGLGGDPLQCQLARPHGVSIHPKTGELYITDSYNDRILKIGSSQ